MVDDLEDEIMKRTKTLHKGKDAHFEEIALLIGWEKPLPDSIKLTASWELEW